eukprot:m.42574 g.42574  ORF g.42574 m.42574 type:complete len:58 (-) comp46466_c0_seq2:61-234(-)
MQLTSTAHSRRDLHDVPSCSQQIKHTNKTTRSSFVSITVSLRSCFALSPTALIFDLW